MSIIYKSSVFFFETSRTRLISYDHFSSLAYLEKKTCKNSHPLIELIHHHHPNSLFSSQKSRELIKYSLPKQTALAQIASCIMNEHKVIGNACALKMCLEGIENCAALKFRASIDSTLFCSQIRSFVASNLVVPPFLSQSIFISLSDFNLLGKHAHFQISIF